MVGEEVPSTLHQLNAVIFGSAGLGSIIGQRLGLSETGGLQVAGVVPAGTVSVGGAAVWDACPAVWSLLPQALRLPAITRAIKRKREV